jgi:Glycosyl transferase family 2
LTNSGKLAICALAKDEGLYIEEWIAFHFLQGVSEILIFDNESTDNMRDILARIARHAPVTVLDWPGDNYYQMQMEAYRAGAKRLSRRAEWVAFIDIDEFLFSSRNLSMPRELAEFGSEVGAIAIGHRIFGSSGHAIYSPEFVTSRFVRCAKPDDPQSRWFKTIARPTAIERFDSAHSVILKSGAYLLADRTPLQRDSLDWHPGLANRVGHGNIRLFHYMVKSLEEYRWKQRRFGDKQLEDRYNDQFFSEHDTVGNQVTNDELRRFAEPIGAIMARWRSF